MLTGTLPPVSNKADWIETFELTDDETGELVDISTATDITVEIKDNGRDCVRYAATLDDGIELVSTGIFQWAFTADQMRSLCAGTFDVRMRITIDDIVTQLFVGHLPVLDG